MNFRLADGSSTDLVALTLPVFFVRTPEAFLELMAARIPDPATGGIDLEKILACLGDHPEGRRRRAVDGRAHAGARNVPARYFGIHALLVRRRHQQGPRRKVRYRWEPDAYEVHSDDDPAGLDADYLAGAPRRGRERPSSFTLLLTLGSDVDERPIRPPMAGRASSIVAGRLELTEIPEDQASIHALIFDRRTWCRASK